MRASPVLAALFAVIAGVVTAPAVPGEAADPIVETILSPGISGSEWRTELPYGAGATGALVARDVSDDTAIGDYHRFWVGADGSRLDVGTEASGETVVVGGHDVIASYHFVDSVPVVQLIEMPSGTRSPVDLGGFQFRGLVGHTVVGAPHVTYQPGDTLYLFDLVDGATVRRPVTGLPDGATGQFTVRPWDAASFLIMKDGVAGVVDLTTAAYRRLGELPGYTANDVLGRSATHLFWCRRSDNTYWAMSRTGGEAFQVHIPNAPVGSAMLGMVGDRFVVGARSTAPQQHTELVASRADGSGAQTLITNPYFPIQNLADGSFLMIGGATGERKVWRISSGPDGSLAANFLYSVPDMPAKVSGLALAGRRLFTADDVDGSLGFGRRALGLAGPFVPGTRQALRPDSPSGTKLVTNGDAVAYESGGVTVMDNGVWRHFAEPQFAELISYTGQFVSYRLYDESTRDSVFVIRNVHTGQIVYRHVGWDDYVLTWGDRVLTQRGTWISLRTGAVVGQVPSAACAGGGGLPGQVAGDWILFFHCGAPRALNVRTGRGVTLNSADFGNGGWPQWLGLGDGYLVYTTVTPGPKTVVRLLDLTVDGAQPKILLESPAVDSFHNVGWTIDQYGGQSFAYVDSVTPAIHVLPLGLPASPLSRVDSDVPARTTTTSRWQPYWEFSKPATWRLELTGSRGSVQIFTGITEGTAVRPDVSCNCGLTGADWKLTVTPADGVGAPLVLTGRVLGPVLPRR